MKKYASRILGVILVLGIVISLFMVSASAAVVGFDEFKGTLTELSDDQSGHCLTTRNAFSPDSQWVVYDTRTHPGSTTSPRIEIVNIKTKEVKVLYDVAKIGKGEKFVGIVTYHPTKDLVIFARGPENDYKPGDANYYGYFRSRRLGTMVYVNKPNEPIKVETRDETVPYTVGGIRGGTHVQLFDTTGKYVTGTYDDNVSMPYGESADANGVECNRRTIVLSKFMDPVNFSKTLNTENGNQPGFSQSKPDSNGTAVSAVIAEISSNKNNPDSVWKATSEVFVGTNGYIKADGKTRQNTAVVFIGELLSGGSDLFVADLPDNWDTQTKDIEGKAITGTQYTRMSPPAGTVQRRLTFNAPAKGVSQPKFASNDGKWIYYKTVAANNTWQIFRIDINSTKENQIVEQITNTAKGVASDFSISYDFKYAYYLSDSTLFVTEIATGKEVQLTENIYNDKYTVMGDACVVSPDGQSVVFQRKSYNTDVVAGRTDANCIGVQLMLFKYAAGSGPAATSSGTTTQPTTTGQTTVKTTKATNGTQTSDIDGNTPGGGDDQNGAETSDTASALGLVIAIFALASCAAVVLFRRKA